MDTVTFIGYFLAALAVLMAVVFAFQLRQCWRSLSWPSAVAVILTSRTTKLDEDDSYDLAVTYAYRVAGCDHVGTRMRFTGTNVLSQRSLTKLTRKYAPHAVVHVYYSPARPGESVLEPGFTWSLLWPLFWLIMLTGLAWHQLR
ncbi:DUF3592 domain-containing protein [Massilia aquatica]|uniref:DUF3592 domain-containing protein n=1 Tax=Massilia aquatica TaxID=2609000 RepID=A0ABX0MI07_9BURK|nr:DUF3592 domain-containing protein [Massilia aquatica]NHZ43129.1 DUF3592 domain-containing protein [Massilia aquatica]